MRWLATAAVLGLVALPWRAARGDDFRCGARLVELGDTETEVHEKCGEPTTRTRRSTKGRRGRVVKSWDEWLYDPGPTAFVRILTFDAGTGRLVQIALGDYGR